MSFSCPLCHQPLTQANNSFVCPGRHQFDVAKEGYVNLLPVQHKRSRDPGDSAEMMQARRAFLDEVITYTLQYLAMLTTQFHPIPCSLPQ